MPAPAGTKTADGAVLGDLAANDQLDDLAPLRERVNRNPGSAPPALTGAREREDNLMIRGIDQETGCALVALLSARLATARLALRARRGLPEWGIRGRRLAGVMAVLVQTGFQLSNPLAQLLDQLRLLGDQGAQPFQLARR
jgi:hypothetical protein